MQQLLKTGLEMMTKGLSFSSLPSTYGTNDTILCTYTNNL